MDRGCEIGTGKRDGNIGGRGNEEKIKGNVREGSKRGEGEEGGSEREAEGREEEKGE